MYKRICLVKGEAWSPEKQDTWREEIIGDYGDGADEELFCIPTRAGTRCFPSALLEAVSDDTVKIVRKSFDDSFTFVRRELREKEAAAWLKLEVRGTLLLHNNPVYLGKDFARSGGLISIFLDELLPGSRLATFLVIELRNMPFDQQRQTILYLMNAIPNFGGAAFDARGSGRMIAEYAAQEWPGYAEQVMLSVKWYAENFPKLKGRMEDSTTNIPDDPFIRDDFRAAGLKAGVPCVLERTGDTRNKRHGDGAAAKLMAVYAADADEEKGYQPMTCEAVETENRYRGKKDLWDD